MYFRTNQGDMYRTEDEGKSWERISINSLLIGIQNTTSRVWRHAKGAPMPDGTHTMYFWSGPRDRVPDYKQKLWVTSDGGSTYQLRKSAPIVFEDILPHPYFPGVALIFQNTGIPRRIQLWKTEDAGLTFERLFHPFVFGPRTTWAVSREQPYRIIAGATLGITPSASAFWNNKVIVSDNYFADYRLLIEHVQDWRLQMIDWNPDLFNSSRLTPPKSSRRLLDFDAKENGHTSTQSPSLDASNADYADSTDLLPTEDIIDEPIASVEQNYTYHQTMPDNAPSSLFLWANRYTSSHFAQASAISINPGLHWESTAADWTGLSFSLDGERDPRVSAWDLRSISNSTIYLTSKHYYGPDSTYKVSLNPSQTEGRGQIEANLLLPHHKSSTFSVFHNLPGTMIADQYVQENETRTPRFFTYRSGNGGALFERIEAPSSTPATPRFLVFTGISDTSPLVYGITSSLGSLFVTATELDETTAQKPLNYTNVKFWPKVNSYFTADGGYNWQEVGTGYHIPEYAARGALIVSAVRDEATDKIVFSLDDGQTWRSANFTNKPVKVQNIRVASDYNSRTLYILARSTKVIYPTPGNDSSPNSPEESSNQPLEPEDDDSNPSEAVPLTTGTTFENPLPPPAVKRPSDSPLALSEPTGTIVPKSGNDSSPTQAPSVVVEPQVIKLAHVITANFETAYPLCQSYDYELWTPKDKNGRPRCLMGESIVFKRRKAGHFCFPQPPASDPSQSDYAWPQVVTRESCYCTSIDYECGPCFERTTSEEGATCRFICGHDPKSDISSRFPSLPYDNLLLFCNAPERPGDTPRDLRYFPWKGSASVVYRKNAQSKCINQDTAASSLPTTFPDAIIPCAFVPKAPNIPHPSLNPTKGLLSYQVKLIIYMSISLFCIMGCTCGLIHCNSVRYFIFDCYDRIQSRGGPVNFEDYEFPDEDGSENGENGENGHGNAIEMSEIVPETTTSSDEEGHLFEPKSDSDEEDID